MARKVLLLMVVAMFMMMGVGCCPITRLNISIQLDKSFQEKFPNRQIQVDVVGVQVAEDDVWMNYSMTKYWANPNDMSGQRNTPLIKTLKFTRDDAKRAIKFSQLVSVPPEMRDDDGSPDELAALGRGLAALKLPSKSDVSRQLDTIAEHQIPFVVVTGGWSPAFEAIGASASVRGGGTHVVVESDHHFPNLVNDEFNDTLDTLMRNADASHREQA